MTTEHTQSVPFLRADGSVNRGEQRFYFYSIIKAFNLGQQFFTQNDQNAISPNWPNRIGNLFEIDMGGAHCCVAPMQSRKRCPLGEKRPNTETTTHSIWNSIALLHRPSYLRDVLGRRILLINKRSVQRPAGEK